MNLTSQNKNKMKIGFFTPYLQSNRGNSITARRIVSGLRQSGFNVEIFAYDEDDWNDQVKEMMESCDLFHILHFDRFSKWQQKWDFLLEKPYVLTSGGTDVHEKLGELSSQQLLFGASALTVFTKEAVEHIIEVYPRLEDKIEIVPQSIWIPESVEPLAHPLPEGFPKVLLPSGVRKVKDVFYVTDEVKTFVNDYPQLQFVVVGEPIEQAEVDRVMDFEEQHEWFTYIGSVTVESMSSIYEWADIVLNTSHSEGQPIALMEAMYYGKPVMARRNAGNTSLIEDGVSGFLFDNPSEFLNQLQRLFNDENLYEQFSNSGRKAIIENFSLAKEIRQYTKIYEYIRGEDL